MNINDINALAQIMTAHSLSEINIEENGTAIRLCKSQNTTVVNSAPVVIEPVKVVEETAPVEGRIIKSPTVGIFYSAPSPDSKNYVSIGSNIKNGDVICIIEAMKMMNEIQSDLDGEIVEIMVGNGQVVEYDQALFRVK